MRGVGGGGSAAQNGQGIAVVQIVERLQRRRVVLLQSATQRVGVPGAGPDQVLVRPGEDLDRLDLWAVAGQRAVVVAVVRTRSASSLASPASDFAPET